MIIVNEDKIKKRRQSMAYKMRIPSSLLLKLAHKGGKIGRAAVAFDSWQSRTLDRGQGVYSGLK